MRTQERNADGTFAKGGTSWNKWSGEQKDDPKYRRKAWLEREYIIKRKTTEEIGNELNHSSTTINNWLRRFNIPLRSHGGRLKNELYHKEEWLKTQYVDNEKTMHQIGGECGVTDTMILYFLKKFSIETRDRGLKGQNHLNWKGGGIAVKCAYCEKDILRNPWRIEKYQHHFCSSSCYYKWRKEILDLNGENNPGWKGGVSFDPYSLEFNEELKERIRQRDGYMCQLCGLSNEDSLQEHGKKLSVHHRDEDKQNCGEENLITLCQSCHNTKRSKELVYA